MGNFSPLFRSSGPSRSKKRRLVKNLQKRIMFKSFSHVPSSARALKISRKSIRRRFANALRDRSFAKRASFHVGGRKITPKSRQGRLGRRPGAYFGALGGLLGRCRGLLGDSWSALRALWDRSWDGLGALLARSWALLSALGRFWTLPGRFWLDFSPPEIDFGTRFWTRYDQTWSHLGRSLRGFGKNVTTTVSVDATPIDAVSSELGVIRGGRRERLTTAWQQQRRKRIIESEITSMM